MDVRSSVCAGRFYPEHKNKLRAVIEASLEGVPSETENPPQMVASPHAGYQFCGPMLAKSYGHLSQTEEVDVVFIFGPAHFEVFEGIALPPHDAFGTPFGPVEIADEFRSELLDYEGIVENGQAHRSEHSLETQMPYFQYLFSDFKIVPLLTGDVGDEDVVELIDYAFDKANAVVDISTDLSHFLDYETACEVDSETAKYIENGKPTEITPDHACGFKALRGAVRYAEQNDMRIERYGMCNSGDTTENRSEVVGYGSWGFYDA